MTNAACDALIDARRVVVWSVHVSQTALKTTHSVLWVVFSGMLLQKRTCRTNRFDKKPGLNRPGTFKAALIY